jgi:hypothetical protein
MTQYHTNGRFIDPEMFKPEDIDAATMEDPSLAMGGGIEEIPDSENSDRLSKLYDAFGELPHAEQRALAHFFGLVQVRNPEKVTPHQRELIESGLSKLRHELCQNPCALCTRGNCPGK